MEDPGRQRSLELVEQTGFHVCIAALVPTGHSSLIESFQTNRQDMSE